MDPTHLHLMLNHVPVLGTLFGLLGLAFGLYRSNMEVIKFSFGVFVLGGLFAGIAYFSGHSAEEIVEHFAGISETQIEAHENAAFYAALGAGILGVFALGALVFFRQKLPRAVGVVMLVLALAVGGVMAWTANLGGQIRHPEIRPDGLVQQVDDETPPATYEEHDDDD